MSFSEIRQTLEDAKTTISRADMVIGDAAKLMAGRLRQAGVDPKTLAKLKRELRDFSLTTGKWSDK